MRNAFNKFIVQSPGTVFKALDKIMSTFIFLISTLGYRLWVLFKTGWLKNKENNI